MGEQRSISEAATANSPDLTSEQSIAAGVLGDNESLPSACGKKCEADNLTTHKKADCGKKLSKF